MSFPPMKFHSGAFCDHYGTLFRPPIFFSALRVLYIAVSGGYHLRGGESHHPSHHQPFSGHLLAAAIFPESRPGIEFPPPPSPIEGWGGVRGGLATPRMKLRPQMKGPIPIKRLAMKDTHKMRTMNDRTSRPSFWPKPIGLAKKE